MYLDLFQFYPIWGTTSNVPERYILGIPQVHLGYTWNVPNFAMGIFSHVIPNVENNVGIFSNVIPKVE